jgi:hypothetical protein
VIAPTSRFASCCRTIWAAGSPTSGELEVDRTLASVPDCADELALLQVVREAYEPRHPAVNVARSLRRCSNKAARPVMRSWRRSQAFQIAGAVSFIALGGISLAVRRRSSTASSGARSMDTFACEGRRHAHQLCRRPE